MKKIILLATTLCLFLVGLVGCSADGLNEVVVDGTQAHEISQASEPLRVHSALDGSVTMTITNQNISQNYVVVTIYNNSEYVIITGYGFGVEYHDGQNWWFVPITTPFHGLPITINPSESFDSTKMLNYTAIPLSSGLHRIRKDAFRLIDGSGNVENFHDLIAEFQI